MLREYQAFMAGCNREMGGTNERPGRQGSTFRRNLLPWPVPPHEKRQFSWTEDGKSDRMTDLDAIGKAVDAALAASRDKIKNPASGALHYYVHDRVRPYWAKGNGDLFWGITRL
jgi:Cell Wall Hydrolase